MSKEALMVGAGSEAKFSNGSMLRVTILKPKRRGLASSTAIHEAMHAVVAKKRGLSIKTATVRPGPGYLGMVELSAPDEVAAVAPHAYGADGTGHDLTLVEHESSASEAARAIIGENPNEVAAVANLLDEKGTVGDGEIQAKMDEAHNEVVLGENVIVSIFRPNGTYEDHTVRTKTGFVVSEVEDDNISLAKAA